MRIHLLRADSVTPIATYLDRIAAAPGVYQAQLDLAAALSYREGDYRAMYLSNLQVDPRPRPGPDVDFSREPGSPHDVCGLKGDVAERTLDDWLRETGVAVHRRVEGQAFERFLTIESKFCDEERRTAMASFDVSDVPPQLRHLAPLAPTIGAGDDACRAAFLRETTKAARRHAASDVHASADRIGQWLDGLTPPHEGADAAFYWLCVAAEEIANGG